MEVYNSYTKKKELFNPLEDKEVKMYVCGPTVYDDAHLGHARSQIAFDLIYRYLQYKGYNVKYVSNYTDIEDKMINRANELGIEVKELADKYIKSFKEDMEVLNVKPADIHPKATEEIPDMIEFIEKLEAQGFAYEVDGDVFFDVHKYENKTHEYGTMTNFDLDSDKPPDDQDTSVFQDKKKHRADFALWKSKKEGEPSWETPWGEGRPGWHIECSVMSMKYLGVQIDIHGGGSDLKFPHHTNEIAQTEAVTKKRFCKYWLHNGFVQVKEEKMSKSLGNFWTVKDILKKFDGETIRLFCISTHYRGPIDFSFEALQQAETTLNRIRNVIRQMRSLTTGKEISSQPLSARDQDLKARLEDAHQQFIQALDDDFNSSGALAAVHGLIKEINIYLRSGNMDINLSLVQEVYNQFKDWNQVLGVLDSVLITSTSNTESYVHDLINLLFEIREDARQEKLYHIADQIRAKIKELGIEVEDVQDKTLWKFTGEPSDSEYEQLLKELMELTIQTRQQFREEKMWSIADKIRSKVRQIGIEIEDQQEQSTWKFAE